MSGCDFSTRVYTYDDVPFDYDLTHFNLTDEDLIYKVLYCLLDLTIIHHSCKHMFRQIPTIKAAAALAGQDLTLFASTWSSPGMLGK